ncbi:5'/3'-nucleotidase SurE [Suttonella sp. R2A3]|uniref:5'/3'-nucleotidase SurE n=1 Tax=Suttonella sp. R2A3 TaxID=2908648 RepID=UPI001F3DD0E2|nr:5'/3'-nucleotidase SurE [Suttonella sp. R2A3]UJF24721.1 5'/3'-nucleotidase SurE [Suttonella sp. R2A3]
MFLLLSNDDGYLSPGLRLMADALLGEVERLVVMAPDRDCSGASHSLTLKRPLNVNEHDGIIYSVDGTPSDCVYLGVGGYFDAKPDMVISGINRGANLGDDVMYSGTVAAAFEGRHLGLPAIAVSCDSHKPEHFADAAKVVVDLFRHLREHPLPADTLLNVNIPDRAYGDIKGFRTTVLGQRDAPESLIETHDPRGRKLFWIGPPGKVSAGGEETDFHAVANGYVSVTPLQFDLTRHRQMHDVQQWLEGI